MNDAERAKIWQAYHKMICAYLDLIRLADKISHNNRSKPELSEVVAITPGPITEEQFKVLQVMVERINNPTPI